MNRLRSRSQGASSIIVMALLLPVVGGSGGRAAGRPVKSRQPGWAPVAWRGSRLACDLAGGAPNRRGPRPRGGGGRAREGGGQGGAGGGGPGSGDTVMGGRR